jgi:hypothetical protein
MAKVKQIRPTWMHGLDQEQIAFYGGLDPEQAVCRGKRRHKFHLDDLIPGRQFPEGIELVRIQGAYQLTDHCQRGCGRWVRYTTLAGGAIDWDSARYGGGGARYHATGLGLSVADDRLYMHYIQDEMVIERIKLYFKKAAAS